MEFQNVEKICFQYLLYLWIDSEEPIELLEAVEKLSYILIGREEKIERIDIRCSKLSFPQKFLVRADSSQYF